LNELASNYSDEIEKILAKYPPDQKRSAVMPLLYIAQRSTGYINRRSMEEIAEVLEISVTDVASIVGFYTLFHDHPEGKYRLQVCTDLPCALRGADQFLEKLCENVGIELGETTADGLITIERVSCLAGCSRAPLFQTQSPDGITYHEDQTVESALEYIDGLRKPAASTDEKGGAA
jgi:NADH-quinone oxidoreductase subunit E